MNLRTRFAQSLLQWGAFIQSLPVLVMRPDDLVAFSRQTYARPHDVESWADDSLVDSGLSAYELELLAAVPVKQGELLLLGVGGGREAVPLARMGFRVTGVDYVPAMVERAQENAARRGFCMEGLVQEISRLEVAAQAYDVVWLSTSLYSCVPTRRRRVEMVRRIARALKPGGVFLCQFRMDTQSRLTGPGRIMRRLIAAATFGNLEYEHGDMLWLNIEFLHAFPSEEAVRAELEEGGLSVVSITRDPQIPMRGGVVCRKSF